MTGFTYLVMVVLIGLAGFPLIPLASLLQIYSGGLEPKTFQVIEFSGRLVKDMDHDVAIINQHPMPLSLTFPSIWLETCLAHPFDQMPGDGLNLATGIAAGDEEIVCNGCEFPYLEQDRVKGLPLLDNL